MLNFQKKGEKICCAANVVEKTMWPEYRRWEKDNRKGKQRGMKEEKESNALAVLFAATALGFISNCYFQFSYFKSKKNIWPIFLLCCDLFCGRKSPKQLTGYLLVVETNSFEFQMMDEWE